MFRRSVLEAHKLADAYAEILEFVQTFFCNNNDPDAYLEPGTDAQVSFDDDEICWAQGRGSSYALSVFTQQMSERNLDSYSPVHLEISVPTSEDEIHASIYVSVDHTQYRINCVTEWLALQDKIMGINTDFKNSDEEEECESMDLMDW